MPKASAFTLRAPGILDAIKTDILISYPYEKGELPSVVKTYHAVWDTGASGTVISEKVVRELGLKPFGATVISTANGPCDSNKYYVSLALPNRVGTNAMPVTEANLGNDLDVLVGMDIISQGDFSITNKNGRTVFSFRMPSMSEHDYVPEVTRHNNMVEMHEKLAARGIPTAGKKNKSKRTKKKRR